MSMKICCLPGNKYKTPLLAACLLFVCVEGFAYSPSGYPGAVWMQSGLEGNGIEGTNSQGFVRQGVELERFSGGQSLQAYGQYNWRFRSINENYYNEYTPYVGAMLSFKHVDLGLEFGWPHYTELNQTLKSYDIYANWFRYWSLLPWRKDTFIKAMPLTTWGNLAYDLSNQDGSSTMGWLKLEADMLWLPGDVMAGPYVSYSWRLRTRNANYFNMQGVSAGLAIGNGDISVGAQYAWRQYPELHEQARSIELYVTIYQVWDLLRGKPR